MASERARPWRLACSALVAVLLVRPGAARAEGDLIEVETDALRVVFSLADARIVALETSLTGVPGGARGTLRIGGGDAPPPVRVAFVPEAGGTGPGPARYVVERTDRRDAVVLRFRARPTAGGTVLEQTYAISRNDPVLELTVALSGSAADAEAFGEIYRPELVLAAGSALDVEPAAGLGGLSERVRTVAVDSGDVVEVAPLPVTETLSAGEWVGVRNRYWALLATSEAPAIAELRSDGAALRPDPRARLPFRVYAGPVEYRALVSADPSLAALLFAGRWSPIRALAFGLMFLFDALLRGVGSAGLAIVLLSLAVKVLLHPLTRLAERWQREVNEARALLAPAMAEIRAGYRGEERSRRVFALHREHGVPLFYGLKSLLGVAVQVPVFFAAYHMLDESIALSGVPFLWIRDLGRPDRAATLPFALGFLGDGLNALPFVMTAATLLSSRLHDDGSLPHALLRRQRRGLYAMAGAFLLLFYTFPAGMVLYWTTNNLVSCARYGLHRLVPHRRDYRGVENHGTSSP